jgi:uncharacterized protein (DUF362 family)
LRRDLIQLIESVATIPRRSTVFIKPNFGSRKRKALLSEGTSSETLRAVVDICRARDSEVIVGHSPLINPPDATFNRTIEDLLQNHGAAWLMDSPGVRFINLEEDALTTFERDGHTLRVPESYLKADYRINLCKLKTHMQTMVSLGIKNLMGLATIEDKIAFHTVGLTEHLVHFARVACPDLTVIEGVHSMEGTGPHDGRDRLSNLLLAGNDLLEIDTLAARLMGFEPETIKHLVLARRLGVGRFWEDDGALDLRRFVVAHRAPQNFIVYGKQIYIWPCESCSICGVALHQAFKHALRTPFHWAAFALRFFYQPRTDIIFGKRIEKYVDTRPLGRTLYFGDCVREYCEARGLSYFHGCPPSIEDTHNWMMGQAIYGFHKRQR